MRRTSAIFFAFLLLAALIPASPAQACRRSPPSPHETYKNALMIFEGEVLNVQRKSYERLEMRLRVEKVYKGRPEKEVLVFDPYFGTSCSNGLSTGIKYIIYVYPRKEGLAVTSCSGTQRLDSSQPIDFSAINERIAEIKTLDDAISKDSARKADLLKVKAAQQLYWQDYQQAEVTLRQLREIEPQNRWVIESLLNVLFQLKKPQEIFDLYTSTFAAPLPQIGDWENENIVAPWSYAWISLSKEIPKDARLVLKDMHFENTKNENLSQYGASFERVSFKNGTLRGSRLEGGNFLFTHFQQSDLSETIFNRGRFRNVGFFETNLRNADFTDAEFEKGSFSGDLSNAIFKNARFHQTSFRKATLDGTDFSNAQIFNSHFAELDFSKANLAGIQLTGSTYTCETKWPEGFDPVAAGAKMQERCDKPKQAQYPPPPPPPPPPPRPGGGGGRADREDIFFKKKKI
ncbi:MAG: pentapeptide repeat-containing protein [Alphaproteobacteria bacterium]|nr:pentapeptide repeat-containing protein [Alphaproteobacteria bacterium]